MHVSRVQVLLLAWTFILLGMTFIALTLYFFLAEMPIPKNDLFGSLWLFAFLYLSCAGIVGTVRWFASFFRPVLRPKTNARRRLSEIEK